MIKVRFKEMKNAYGIGELKVNYNSDSILYQSLIYSRNGTFKTSFSKTLNNLSKGNIDDIKDRLTNTPATIKIEFINDEGQVTKNDFDKKFIVFSREIFDNGNLEISKHTQELSLLTTDNDSKNKLNKLMSESIEKIKESLSLKFKNAGINEDKAINLLTGKSIDDLSINDFNRIIEQIDKVEDCDISKINLKNLFQKAYDPIETENFKELANNYVDIFNKRLNEELFDEEFNDSNCLTFLEGIKKNGYLNESKKRGIILKGKEYYKYEEIESVFKETIKNVTDDLSVLKANNELVKAMGTSAEARKLQKQFANDPLLINQLALGKSRILFIALKKQGFETEKFKYLIKITKEEYKKIIEEAKNKKSNFESAIEIYKTRFKPVFDILISNKNESILGEKIPILSFRHQRNKELEMSEKEIRDILSSGEKTALNIISFIVEYEANKRNDPILILDDLVETFDYANRHAFIEYINDLVKENVSVIILTHNYEFYRTLGRRIPELNKLSAYSKNGKVYIEENKKLNFEIERVFEIKNINQLICAIPFLREIKTMLKENTNILDNCLHYKKDTKNLTISTILNEFPTLLFEYKEDNNYLSLLYNLANNINLSNQYDIIPKTILSIACRLKLEEVIISDDFNLISDIEKNQLSELKKIYKQELTEEAINIIEEVQIATPEFIHCNSFMYEPLIDIEGIYLLDLYKKIQKLTNADVWK